MKKITITTEYVTLGQFLKLANLIGSGGEAKFFLSKHEILVDGVVDNRRGRKLYSGAKIEIQKDHYIIERI